MSKHKRCGAILSWRMLGGMLVTQGGKYGWRCPSCFAQGEQSEMPKHGAACKKLVPAEEAKHV